MNIIDKSLLLNKLKDISIQNKIINNIKTTAEIAIIESEPTKLISPNTPAFFNSQEIENVDINQPVCEKIIEESPIPESINLPQIIAKIEEKLIEKPLQYHEEPIQELIQEPIQEPSKEPIQESILELIQEPSKEPIKQINLSPEAIEKLDINAIIESIKEPIALLEKYLLTNSVPININKDELNNYINIYKTITSLKDLNDIKKLSEYTEKTSCFTAIKNMLFKK